MADAMDERVRSIELTAGITFTAAALVLSLSIALFPTLPPENQTNLILESLQREGVGYWMWLHAAMIVGFLLAATAFAAFSFLLHLRGSSGAASIATVSALAGATLWAAFLSAEFFVMPFVMNHYSLEPGLATLLFNVTWYWKMGAIAIGGGLFFVAVLATALGGLRREIIPFWLGGAGILFAGIGILAYMLDFAASTATGAAINPMRSPLVRYGVGFPLQLWMLATGATLLRSLRERGPVVREEKGAIQKAPDSRNVPPVVDIRPESGP